MFAKFFLQYLLAVSFGVGVDQGKATVYGTPGDVFAQGLMACNQRPVPQDEPLCAHRWLPCGTVVLVENLERKGRTACRVTDRGPFVAQKWGRWKGAIDLTPQAARTVHLDGKDWVRLVYKLPPPGHKAYEFTSFLIAHRRNSLRI